MNSWKGFVLWPDAPAVTVYSRTIHGITALGSGVYSDKRSRSEFKVRRNLVFSAFNWGKVYLFLDDILLEPEIWLFKWTLSKAFEDYNVVAGEVAQGLGALAALAEDPSWFWELCRAAAQTVTLVPEVDSAPYSGLWGYPPQHTLIHIECTLANTHTYT